MLQKKKDWSLEGDREASRGWWGRRDKAFSQRQSILASFRYPILRPSFLSLQIIIIPQLIIHISSPALPSLPQEFVHPVGFGAMIVVCTREVLPSVFDLAVTTVASGEFKARPRLDLQWLAGLFGAIYRQAESKARPAMLA